MKYLLAILLMALFSFSATGSELRKETNEYYIGKIAGKYEFKMVLSKESTSCSGSYYYTKHKKPIYLYGVCSGATIKLQEQEDQLGYLSKKTSNSITAEVFGKEIKGKWRSADGNKEFEFFAETVVPDKRELLSDAAGRYSLKNISGFYGANTMTDIYRSRNQWVSSGSSISAGMRQGYKSDLSKKDKKLLSSFVLVVDSNGNINIKSSGKEVATFPFTEKSAFSVTKVTRDEDSIGRIFVYDGSENFIENNLHISTTDKFDMNSYLVFEDTPIDEVHVLSLNYDPVTLEFVLRVFDGNCCGSTSLYFERN